MVTALRGGAISITHHPCFPNIFCYLQTLLFWFWKRFVSTSSNVFIGKAILKVIQVYQSKNVAIKKYFAIKVHWRKARLVLNLVEILQFYSKRSRSGSEHGTLQSKDQRRQESYSDFALVTEMSFFYFCCHTKMTATPQNIGWNSWRARWCHLGMATTAFSSSMNSRNCLLLARRWIGEREWMEHFYLTTVVLKS